MTDASAVAREAEASLSELKASLHLMTVIAELSSKFINLPTDEIDHEIEDAQRRVCECVGLDLSSLWQWEDGDPASLNLTHLHRTDSGPPIPLHLKAKIHFPWTLEQLRAGKTVRFSTLEDLPTEAGEERETRRQMGITAAVTFPLAAGGQEPVGAVSFNSMSREFPWPDLLVNQLRMVAEIFGNALARKRSEQLLRESEQRLALAADSAGAGLWSIDLASGAIWTTGRALELFGLSSQEQMDLETFLGLVHSEDRELVHRTIQRLVRDGGESEIDYRINWASGQERWISSRGRILCDPQGAAERLVGVSVDISERKMVERNLRELGGRLIAAHEEEHARISRELHDDVTQRLACLAIDIAQIELHATDAPIAIPLAAVREGLASLSEDVHALAYRLHPSILRDLGLADALQVECRQFSASEGLPVEFTLDELPELIPKDTALCVYRVVQEALRNVARHARASTVGVSLRGRNEGLQATVRDDGIGFDISLVNRQPTLGLTSMRERVRLLGGTLELLGGQGLGTTLEIWVPVSRSGG